jgi:D-alanyl-D-alanine carboxypeptidase/D-alanyl-D-alanine-endopeptidase (penicillin-binding protein 4)
MRTIAATAGALVAAAAFAPALAGAQATGTEDALRAVFAGEMAKGPAASGAYVVDLGDGHVVFDDRGAIPRLSASTTKLYTTSTALLRLGTRTRLVTRVLGTGARRGSTWHGDLYLRGAGDFTFGTAAFGAHAYGGGSSVQDLARDLRRRGIRRVDGSVLADASQFRGELGSDFRLVLCPDPLFGAGCPYGPAGHLERPIPNGPRTAISTNRGLRRSTSAAPQRHPVRFAARTLRTALRHRGIRVTGRTGVATTPRGAHALAATKSPGMARLAALINRPSDNYAADTMQQVIGLQLADRGTRAAGARATTAEMERRFGVHPAIVSGSGETLGDKTSPQDLVRLLAGMQTTPAGTAFARSLSLAGRNGTLRRYAGTPAEGRCELKDGTRVDPKQPNTTLNIAGYCHSAGGRTFAFAVMMNGMPLEFVPPDKIESPAYALQDRMVQALAQYQG